MAEEKHQRRIHYSGKYPRHYKEKYKELNPEKYSGILEKVQRKGTTPAGTHIPIFVKEIMDILKIKPGERGFDATLGYGGHSRIMLEKLNHQGHLYATDVDPIESAKTQKRLAAAGFGADDITICHTNFANIDQIAAEYGKFDFVLADLGVSSMQIDNPERGFTYKFSGPLDLRMNPEQGVSAAERLKNISVDELEGMLETNADEPYARLIAKTIVNDLSRGQEIATTDALYHEIEKALLREKAEDKKELVKKTAARVFQALRIDINHEYEVLYDFLSKLPECVNPGGRIVILTFHSGEDRLVKQAFKEYYRQGIYSDISQHVIRPSAEECARNSRAHSTKLRWAVKA